MEGLKYYDLQIRCYFVGDGKLLKISKEKRHNLIRAFFGGVVLTARGSSWVTDQTCATAVTQAAADNASSLTCCTTRDLPYLNL